MPHLIIEYSRELEREVPPGNLMQIAHDTSVASGLFDTADIKVRLLPTDHALVAGKAGSFLHINLYLLTGRRTETKKQLTQALVEAYKSAQPNLASISADARDMDRRTYSKTVR